MSRNNVKLLTRDQLETLNEKYDFDVEDNNIVVKIKGYNRKTVHPIDKPFHINAKVRKVCFSLDAIDLWLKLRERSKKWSLFDVQQAVNIAYITCCPLQPAKILYILEHPTFKIKEET